MASTIILSDNGASSGSAGLKSTAGNDGVLILQTTTSGGTATNAIYINTSQSVGIGTSSPTSKLHVVGPTGNGIAYNDGTVTTYMGATSSNKAETGTLTNHSYALLTNATERMLIDTSGNVGIGTSSPVSVANSKVLTIDGTNSSQIYLKASGTTYGLVYATAAEYSIYGSGAIPMRFWTNDQERMRIDSSGNLLVGTTTAGGAGSVRGLTIAGGSTGSLGAGLDYAGAVYKYDAVNENGWIWWNTRSIGGLVQEFFVTSSFTKVGNINCSTTATNYVTSSDYRLKENIQPMTGALAKVAQLKPCTYTWKVDGSEGQGFIAHELGEVVPQCVSGEKDAVNEDGSIDPQGIDTSFLVATLTAAIQEQQALITTLTERITALEAK